MVKIIVYNTKTNTLETYYRSKSQQMPYIRNKFLSVREFLGSSKSNTVWTTRQAMEAFNTTRTKWGKPIYVGYVFKRIYEGGHAYQSQHYAGVSFDVAQNLSTSERKKLNTLAKKLNVWGYVEPINMTPSWVHFDRRYGTPACSAGFPLLKYGSKGVYVLILQDALNTLGYNTGGLDGIFGNRTRTAVANYQRRYGLTQSYTANCETWTSITKRVRGIGRKSTTID